MSKEKVNAKLFHENKELLYELSKQVYEKKIKLDEAVKELSSKANIAEEESKIFLCEYSLMRKGQELMGKLSRDIYEYYFIKIKDENGKDAMKKVLASIKIYLDLSKGGEKRKFNYLYNNLKSGLTDEEKRQVEKEIEQNKETEESAKNNLLHTIIVFADGRRWEACDDVSSSAKFIIDALRRVDEDYMCLTNLEISGMLVSNEEYIQIKTETRQCALINVFATSEAVIYDDPDYCFQDELFNFMIFDENNNEENDVYIPECKLTKAWCLNSSDSPCLGSDFWALVDLVKKLYCNELEITVESIGKSREV